jgi:hypothetical protein
MYESSISEIIQESFLFSHHLGFFNDTQDKPTASVPP